jgi:DNA-binding XRE family transcriptional regulator
MGKHSIMKIYLVETHAFYQARKKLGLSQKDVANAVEIHVTSYQSIESGDSDPKFSTYKKIIELFEEKGIVFNQNGKIEKN